MVYVNTTWQAVQWSR